VAQVVVALPEAYALHPPDWLAAEDNERVRVVAGGETRSLSVQAALGALDTGCRIVLVHDAARPFVSAATIASVISVAERSGALPAVPVSDTIKRGDVSTRLVLETIDRRDLWRAQTPQGCPREMLETAYDTVGPAAVQELTDESSLLEAAGFKVELVPDTAGNFKVTTEDDFSVAEALLCR
jgi:2-C-methyl-D-erythritol 4-phosphate cytidylyltransferase